MIWENQKLPEKLYSTLEIIAEAVYNDIMNPPEGNANIGQWCKKPLCWDSVKKIQLNLKIESDLLTDFEEEKYNKKEDKKVKKLDSSIEIESFVVTLEKSQWKSLLSYYKKDEMKYQISPMQLDILNKYINNLIVVPSPKQAKILYNLYDEAISDGVILK